MKGYHIQKTPIEERAVAIAEYIVKNKATVRQAAGQFGVSKSTVHKDVTERLLRINPSLAAKARKILDVNKSERHIPKHCQRKQSGFFGIYFFAFFLQA